MKRLATWLIAAVLLATVSCGPRTQPIPLFPESAAGKSPAPGETKTPAPAEPAAETLPAAFPAGVHDLALLCHSDRSGDSDVWLLDFGEGTALQLTDHPAFDGFASWSPDRDRIVFVSDRDGNREIYLMDADGDDPLRLTENDDDDSYPVFLPDGETIAFFSRVGEADQLCLMDDDGENLRVLTAFETGQGGPAAISPDGDTIAFAYLQTGNYKIFLIENGGAPREIVAHGCAESRFCFTPDGQALVAASGRGATRDIWKYRFREGSYQRLTRGAGDALSPTISPEADQVAFSSQRDGKNWQLYLLGLDNDPVKNPVVRLTRDSASYYYPEWR
jgi:TolB protein